MENGLSERARISFLVARGGGGVEIKEELQRVVHSRPDAPVATHSRAHCPTAPPMRLPSVTAKATPFCPRPTMVRRVWCVSTYIEGVKSGPSIQAMSKPPPLYLGAPFHGRFEAIKLRLKDLLRCGGDSLAASFSAIRTSHSEVRLHRAFLRVNPARLTLR